MTAELIDGLCNWAEGYTAPAAAVNLLIDHDVWLRRPDFRSRCVVQIPDSDLYEPDRPIAYIDWEQVCRALAERSLPASGSEVAVLRVAASLADGRPVSLRESLTGMDATTTAAVAAALVAAAGHRDRITVALAPRNRPDWL
ncbi:hypothetical protein [Nocardiopsis sp. LOL_012]|uniref:hypothetical protein n=1 Tax=Nocardiopsis sp. LOL_012 TaxID=3345409 RepID=UPI003A87763C